MTETTVGFIGLGEMGEAMTANILAGGYPVVSCANRSRAAIERLAAKGLVEVDGPQAVGAQANILITCVVDDVQTDTVLRGETGALAAMQPGSVVIITSTLSPTYCQTLAAECAEQGIALLDCPISGARARAEDGTLALICGGDGDAIERSRGVMETMGTIYHCGAVGMGQVAKLVNQGVMFGIIELLREGRALARAYGMDLDTLMTILSKSMGQSTAGDNWDAFIANWPHVTKLGQKDLGLITAAARDIGADLPLIEARGKMSWEMADE